MNLTTIPASPPEVLILEPEVFGDTRGFFFESLNAKSFEVATGCQRAFVQDNHSRSTYKVLRDLHYQVVWPQGKLARVVAGEVFNVTVGLYKSPPSFGKRIGAILSAESRRQLWVPEGFAHGFVIFSDSAELLRKITDYWYLEHERSVFWNDSGVGIEWSLKDEPLLAAEDVAAKRLIDADLHG